MAQEDIPRFLNHTEVVSFSYDSHSKMFLIGADNAMVDPRDFSKIMWYNRSDIALGNIHDLYAGMVQGTWLFTGPKFYDYIETTDGIKTLDETPRVMLDVYNSIHHTKARKSSMNNSPWGFYANKLRPGHAIFNVLGDCACLGVTPDGFIRHRDWGSKFAQYDLHNSDYDSQTISLYAGLGFVAGKASAQALMSEGI